MVIVTDHAEKQWVMRTHQYPTPDLEGLWDESVALPDTHDLTGDEVRYYEPEHMLLVRNGCCLSTAIDANTARQPTRDAINQAISDDT